MPRELFRDMLRGRRMAREIGQHRAALIDAAIGIALAEHDLIARLVQAFVEDEFAAVLRIVRIDPGPAGEHFGEVRDVGLGVAAADAERVQFERLAREIFVQAPCRG